MTTETDDTHRAIERVVLRMSEQDIPDAEIARRLGRRVRSIRQIRWLAGMRPFTDQRTGRSAGTPHLTPIERCVLRLRNAGESYGLIGTRVQRSGAQVRRIEAYAHFKTSGRWPDPRTLSEGASS